MADRLSPPPLPEGWTVERLRHTAKNWYGGFVSVGLTYYADALEAEQRAQAAQPDAPSPAQLRAMWDVMVAEAKLQPQLVRDNDGFVSHRPPEYMRWKASLRALLRAAGEG